MTEIKKEITSEEIKAFMEGHDPMERIVNVLYSYENDYVTVLYRNDKDQKCSRQEPFYPFVWATEAACKRLCDGNRDELKGLMARCSVGVKKLNNVDINGVERREFDDGYRFMFFARKPMSQRDFLAFFKKCRNPIYGKKDDKDKSSKDKVENRQFLSATPVEQFLMSTGKRFFKGYDDYDNILKMTFDLETTGLDTKHDRIVQIGIEFNRPFYGHPDGFKKIFNIEGDTKEERDANELKAIVHFLEIIYTFKPDIITAHNGENFDWQFLIDACKRLGTTMEDLSSRYFDGDVIRKDERESTLKLGGETEGFYRTIVPGIIVTDSLHAVRRAQATDSNFAKADLKYSTEYLGMKKKNRVYTPGSEISNIYHDLEEHYAFNDDDGDWYLYDPSYIEPPKELITPDPMKTVEYFQEYIEDKNADVDNFDIKSYLLRENPDAMEEYLDFIRDEIDNMRLEIIRNNPDIDPNEDPFEMYFDDEPSEEEIEEMCQKIPFEEWAKREADEYDIPEKETRTAQELYDEYIKSIEEENAEILRVKKGKEGDKPFIMYTRNKVMDGYKLVSGKYIIERYLYDDLWECEKVEKALNGSDFMLTKFLPLSFAKACTMGTAGQWKALMMAWSYEQNLAIPLAPNTGSFTGGLSRLLKTGYVDSIAKFDYNSLYPSIILTWAISDEGNDLMGSTLKFLEYVLTEREKHKKLKKAADKIVGMYEDRINKGEKLTEEEMDDYKKNLNIFKVEDNNQLVFKKLGNSFFGAFGSNNGAVYPWKSVKCAERTTCTGRQSLRLMISHFTKLGYTPLVGDTDGFNFQLPKTVPYRYTEEHPYISVGLSRETKEGKAYTGFEADVAEFNDLYMKDFHYAPNAVNKMGLGIDEILDASINFSRKNYADWFPEKPEPRDVKLVGNTVKSKKLQEYIAKFLAVGIRQLLRGDGFKFLQEYYKTFDKIYNLRVPLRDIASKGKIKKSLAEYQKDVTTITKAGREKSRQAWYELAIANNLDVHNGDTIYYINTGTSKSHSDVKKVTHYYAPSDDGLFNGEIIIDKEIEKGFKKYRAENKGRKLMTKDEWIKENYPQARKDVEINLNCMLVPREIIESETDSYCGDISDDMEYNIPKYIEQFNNRIKPLLVCFDSSIRSKILITKPEDKPFFKKSQCKLVSGQPNKPSDQDTYEQLMTMEDKEIAFWKRNNLVPPFLEECGMGKWEDILADYDYRMAEEERLGIKAERDAYILALNGLTLEEVEKFLDEGEISSHILDIIEPDPLSNNFLSKKFPNVKIGSIDDYIDRYESLKYCNEGEDE